MNATRSSVRGQPGQLERADPDRPVIKAVCGRGAVITTLQSDRVDLGLYLSPAETWLLWK